MVYDVLQRGPLVSDRFNRNDLAAHSPQSSRVSAISSFVPQFSFQATEDVDNTTLVASHLNMHVASTQSQRDHLNSLDLQMYDRDATEWLTLVFRQDGSSESLEGPRVS